MTLFHHLGIVAASGGVVAAPGMVLLTPTSITHSGTSASIGANGQVTFTNCTSVSVNGVFGADFDNYVIFTSAIYVSGGGVALSMRYRASGTDASGTDYVHQRLTASSTTVSAARTSSATSVAVGGFVATLYSGYAINVYGPALAQPTASRSVSVYAESGNQEIQEYAATHSLSTSYDGMTFLHASGANGVTGKLAVYGVRS